MKQHNDLDFLTTKQDDITFHESRIMFCIKKDKLEVAPENIKSSHLEWFKDMGWVNETNAEDFLEENVRGFYLKKENALYCYKGVGFKFDEKVLNETLRNISQFQKMNVTKETELHLGPKDPVIHGATYKQMFVGKIGQLSNI